MYCAEATYRQLPSTGNMVSAGDVRPSTAAVVAASLTMEAAKT